MLFVLIERKNPKNAIFFGSEIRWKKFKENVFFCATLLKTDRMVKMYLLQRDNFFVSLWDQSHCGHLFKGCQSLTRSVHLFNFYFSHQFKRSNRRSNFQLYFCLFPFISNRCDSLFDSSIWLQNRNQAKWPTPNFKTKNWIQTANTRTSVSTLIQPVAEFWTR